MASDHEWPQAPTLSTSTTLITPLAVDDADAVAAALDDPRLHAFIGGEPASADQLRERFVCLIAGQSPDGSEGWLNWVIRDRDTSEVIGTLQATITTAPEGRCAEVAWVVATRWQGRGLAKETAGEMVAWLRTQDITEIAAHVHPDHEASAAVARSLGMAPTDERVDGEVRWSRSIPRTAP